MQPTKKNRGGRPPKGSSKTRGIRLDMRLEVTEKQAFRDAAELAGLDLSAWIRERLRWAATKELSAVSRPIAFLNGTGR